jgi:hypothetical protein
MIFIHLYLKWKELLNIHWIKYIYDKHLLVILFLKSLSHLLLETTMYLFYLLNL